MTAAPAPTPKLTLSGLAARYRSALRAHLAGRLVTTRSLVLVHERALAALAVSGDFDGANKRSLARAGRFLALALAPLEATLRVTREANKHLRERNETLRLHTAALARANRRLEREVERRQAGEATIRRGRERYRVLFLESQLMQKKLRGLTRQIISAQEEERKEISRELHDEVVQTLVGINVELAALGKSASTSLHTFQAKIIRTQKLVENSVSAVHRFARELRPAVLDDLGLIPALHAFSRNLAARRNLKIELTVFHGVESLPAGKRTVLFRVAQEALTNVARHAQATQVTLRLAEMPGGIRMEIADNGKSFPVEEILLAPNPKRLGLVGMRERVEMVGGTLAIVSTPGAGTTVLAEIPFRDPTKTRP